MVVWIFDGEGAGTIRTLPVEEGQRLIGEGRAQDCKTTDGRDLKPVARGRAPEDPAAYGTREMRAAEPEKGRRRGRSRK